MVLKVDLYNYILPAVHVHHQRPASPLLLQSPHCHFARLYMTMMLQILMNSPSEKEMSLKSLKKVKATRTNGKLL